MQELLLKIERLPHAEGLEVPGYQTAGSSGMDLRAALDDPVTLERGGAALVPTGFRMEIPPGYEGQVRTRSGLAASHGVAVLNSPGTIDSDYRGEVKIILVNLGSDPVTVERGDRIAQLIITPVARVVVAEAESLEDTDRGEGGFGSTGVE